MSFTREHVAGGGLYTDDLCLRYPGLLHAWLVMAPLAHGVLTRLSAARACEVPGVYAVLTGDDVPGENDSGSSRRDEPLFTLSDHRGSAPYRTALAEKLVEKFFGETT